MTATDDKPLETHRMPGLMSRLVEVMAPEAKGALGVVRGLEGGLFTAAQTNAMIAGVELPARGMAQNPVEANHNNIDHGLPAHAITPQAIARSQDQGMGLAKK